MKCNLGGVCNSCVHDRLQAAAVGEPMVCQRLLLGSTQHPASASVGTSTLRAISHCILIGLLNFTLLHRNLLYMLLEAFAGRPMFPAAPVAV